MAKAWRVVIIIVLIAVILGSVLIGVGMMTGANFERLYGTVAERYNLVEDPVEYAQYVQDVIDALRPELLELSESVRVIG